MPEMTPATAAKVLREMVGETPGSDHVIDGALALGALALEAFGWMTERKAVLLESHGIWLACDSTGTLGTGPDPLAAIQDARGKEKWNG